MTQASVLGKGDRHHHIEEFGRVFAAQNAGTRTFAHSEYHLIKVDTTKNGTRFEFRDLRTRNFRTRWGELNLTLDDNQHPTDIEFHV